MNGINRQPLYIKGEYSLIARYNRFDDCVEIADINEPQEGWTDWTTWNVALWIRNDQTYYNIATECKDYMDFLYEMQAMIGSFATPDGADWGEANIEEMNEVIEECN